MQSDLIKTGRWYLRRKTRLDPNVQEFPSLVSQTLVASKNAIVNAYTFYILAAEELGCGSFLNISGAAARTRCFIV